MFQTDVLKKNTDNLRINVTLRHVLATIVAIIKQ